MIELLFVHGVATRPGPEYDAQVRNRDKLITEILFEGAPVRITSAMWGALVPDLAWNGATFRQASASDASLSIHGRADAALGIRGDGSRPAADSTLASIAAERPEGIIDELFETMVATADEQRRDLTANEIHQFRLAASYLSEESQAVIAADLKAGELVDKIRAEIGVAGSYGISDTLKAAALRLADPLRNAVGKSFSALLRDRLNPAVAMFLGDIFAYLKPGEVRNAIRREVVDRIGEAYDRARTNRSKFVLMGHSLGGVILYDLLSSPALAGLPGQFAADALVTVGSQPALFEELGLFDFKAENRGPPNKVAGPPNVGTWVNTFDPIDLFGFRASPVFSSAADYVFDSGTGLASAHTTYFRRPQFYGRLRKRLIERQVIPA